MKLEERIQQNLKNSAITAISVFSKSQPQGLDTDAVLNIGDIIKFPETMPEVYKQVFGSRMNPTTRQPEENFGEFIVVEVENAEGEVRAINFFPSSFTRNIWPAKKEADGTVTTITEGGPLNPKGPAVDFYKSFQGKGTDEKTDVQLAMEAMLGKRVKVTNKVPVDTQRWRNGAPVDELRTTNVFEYDFV